MWFNTKNKNETVCITNFAHEINLSPSMKRGTTYTMCLLEQSKENNEVYTPYDCTGVTTPVEWEEDTWIKNKSIILVACVATISLILAVIISASLVYICIRRHPRLIKGSNKVIIVKEKSAAGRGVERPREFERPAYTAPSITTYEHHYLTPNFHKYAKVRYRPPVHGNLIGRNLYDENSLYVQADAPTRFQLETWRLNVRKRPKLDRVYDQQEEIIDYDEIPPPVPAGHPKTRYNNQLPTIYSHNLYSIA